MTDIITRGLAKSAAKLSKETKEELLALLEDKQDTLVSGENIKTINNVSIVGPGNVQVEGVAVIPALPAFDATKSYFLQAVPNAGGTDWELQWVEVIKFTDSSI